MRHIVEKRLFNTSYYLLAHLDDFVYQMVHCNRGQNGDRFSEEQGGTPVVKKGTTQKKTNSFHIRVYDDDVLTSIYELFSTKEFPTMNDLLNRALAVGIEEIYKKYGKRKALAAETEPMRDLRGVDELLRRVKSTEMTVDDLFVMMSIIELLATTLFNAQRARTAGEPVSVELLDSGYFSTLPENLQAVKDELIRRREKSKKTN